MEMAVVLKTNTDPLIGKLLTLFGIVHVGSVAMIHAAHKGGLQHANAANTLRLAVHKTLYAAAGSSISGDAQGRPVGVCWTALMTSADAVLHSADPTSVTLENTIWRTLLSLHNEVSGAMQQVRVECKTYDAHTIFTTLLAVDLTHIIHPIREYYLWSIHDMLYTYESSMLRVQLAASIADCKCAHLFALVPHNTGEALAVIFDGTGGSSKLALHGIIEDYLGWVPTRGDIVHRLLA